MLWRAVIAAAPDLVRIQPMPLPLEGVRAMRAPKEQNTLARRPGVLRALGAALLTAALSGWAAAQTALADHLPPNR